MRNRTTNELRSLLRIKTPSSGSPLCQAAEGVVAYCGWWRVREVLFRSVDLGVWVSRAGLQSRPHVSSRTRLARGGCVADHLPVDDVGQAAFEGAHGFHRGLALGEPAPVAGAAFGVVAELDDGHDVQDPVDAPVAAPRQAVALLVAGGGIQRGGAVPGGEVRPAAEPVNVADVAEQSGSTGRADAA